jgi:hypothetical protein
VTERLQGAAAWVLAAAMAGALTLILWLGRGTTFSVDELAWLATTPGLDLDDALAPHGGHLILTSRLVYYAALEAFGSGYETFRLLTALTLLLTAGLFFVYAARRVGRVVALAPTLILLVFGSDSVHVLVGNGFTVLLALSCGLGALLALDREDTKGDAIACALLCLGVVTYTVALAFVAGAAVRILLRDARWQRIWVVLVPVAIYAAWWLWALGEKESSEGQLELANLLLIPAWAFQGLAAAAGALSGLAYEFSLEADYSVDSVGPALALLVVAWVGWRLTRGRVPAGVWAVIAIALTLWAMQAIAPTVFRTPETERFLFPGAIATLLVLVEVGRDVRWARTGLIVLYVVAAAGVATNLAELRAEGRTLRLVAAPQAKVDLGALELSAGRANPGFNPSLSDPPSVLNLPFSTLETRGDPPLGSYLEAASRYGSLGFGAEEIRARPEEDRARADALIAGALGLQLAPAAPETPVADCRRITAGATGTVDAEVPSGGALIRAPETTGPIELRRFASAGGITLASGLQAGSAAELAIPPDAATDPWRIGAAAPALEVCALR